MSNNIIDQNHEDSLAGLFGAFDLRSDESFEKRLEKLSSLFDIYGVDREHTMPEQW